MEGDGVGGDCPVLLCPRVFPRVFCALGVVSEVLGFMQIWRKKMKTLPRATVSSRPLNRRVGVEDIVNFSSRDKKLSPERHRAVLVWGWPCFGMPFAGARGWCSTGSDGFQGKAGGWFCSINKSVRVRFVEVFEFVAVCLHVTILSFFFFFLNFPSMQ